MNEEIDDDDLDSLITNAVLEALESKSQIEQTPEMKAACKKAIEIFKKTMKPKRKSNDL